VSRRTSLAETTHSPRVLRELEDEAWDTRAHAVLDGCVGALLNLVLNLDSFHSISTSARMHLQQVVRSKGARVDIVTFIFMFMKSSTTTGKRLDRISAATPHTNHHLSSTSRS
jgi:hypothetical protein